MPFNQLPVLEVDGVKIAQSDTICKFLAKRFDMAGKNDIEVALIDAVAAEITDIQNKLSVIYFSKDDAAKAEAHVAIPPMFKSLERYLTNHGSKEGYFVGDKMSWADVKIFAVLCIAEHWTPDAVKACPLLVALRNKVGELPKIKKWVEARAPQEIPNI